jgi:ABC-2 type transport system permease protein
VTVTAARAPSALAQPPQPLAALRAVVRHGLRGKLRTLLAWGGSLGALAAFEVAIYPSVKDSIDKVIQSYPAGLREAFGVQGMNTVEGYLHAEMFSLIMPLAMAYVAVRLVTRAVLTAEERGQLDTILALPIRRRVYVAGAYVVGALVCAGILAVVALLAFVAGRAAGTGISLGRLFAGSMGVWPLTLFAAGVATLASGFLHRAAAATGIAMGTIVGMYALDLAGQLANALEPVRWASVFRYYDAPLRDGIDPLYFLGVVAAGVLLAVAGALLFERRDVLH